MEDKKDTECTHGAACKSCGAEKVLKALTSRMLTLTQPAKAKAVQNIAAESETLFSQELLDTQRSTVQNEFEPPVVPSKRIATPAPTGSLLAPDYMTSCGGCGYVHKSLNSCPRCQAISNTNREAAPIWRR